MKSVKRFFSERKLNLICSIASLILIFAVWIVAYYSVKNDFIVPSLRDTFSSFFKCLAESSFWIAFAFTFLRCALSAVLSFFLAAIFAIFSVLSKIFSAMVKPVVAVIRALPTLAVVLILLIWTSPNAAPIIVTMLVLFPMAYTQLIAAINGIDDGFIEMARVYEIPFRDRLFKMYLPLISPNILLQTGANISLGIKVMISAEVLANTYKSLGGLMQEARLYAEMPRLAALTVVAVLVGLIIEFVFYGIGHLTFKWNKREGRND